MATGKILLAVNSVKMLNLTSGQLEKLIYELEDLVTEVETMEQQEEEIDYSDLDPYNDIARENCNAF